jgi:hypothetical protein
VEHVEVRCLAEVGSLAADLEGEPLAAEVRLDEGGVAEEVGGVVLGDEVLEYCAAFPEAKAGVGVIDCWGEGVRCDSLVMHGCCVGWECYRVRGRWG